MSWLCLSANFSHDDFRQAYYIKSLRFPVTLLVQPHNNVSLKLFWLQFLLYDLFSFYLFSHHFYNHLQNYRYTVSYLIPEVTFLYSLLFPPNSFFNFFLPLDSLLYTVSRVIPNSSAISCTLYSSKYHDIRIIRYFSAKF